MVYYPEYYDAFSCLMGQCRHTCCAGWEIDIDDESLERFRAMPGEIGERLRAGIVEDEEGAHFRLTDEGRCPMLNAGGLCELLLACDGDMDVLCDNCFNHPAFDNSMGGGRIECGLGLCCEAACRLILGWEKPVRLVTGGDDDGEEASEEAQELLKLREDMIADAQDRTAPAAARIAGLSRRFGVEISDAEIRQWIPVLLALERMDEAWTEVLEGCAALSDGQLPELGEAFEIPSEQLLVYLLYRHMPRALDDFMVRERALFCVLMTMLVRALWRAQLALTGRCDLDDMVEICRLFSAEIEYSDENFYAIADRIGERFPE